MFFSFYLVENHKIVNKLTASEARDISTEYESLHFRNVLIDVWIHLKTVSFYNIINRQILARAKVFTG
jgi:hypothetical protein